MTTLKSPPSALQPHRSRGRRHPVAVAPLTMPASSGPCCFLMARPAPTPAPAPSWDELLGQR